MSQYIVKKQPLPVGGIQYDVTHSYDDYRKSLEYSNHAHNCYELYFKISGSTSIFVNNECYRVEDFCVFLVRPNEAHYCIMHTEEKHEHYCLWLELPEALDPFSPIERSCCLRPCYSHAERLQECLNRLLQARATLLEKSAAILEILSIMEKSRDNTLQPSESLFPEEMKRILDFISKDFASIRHVKDICDRFYLSPATLSRWFKKHVGVAPRDYLEAQKLAFSKKLLNQGQSVTDTARACGFGDTSYFIFVFKKSFGLTPAEFRRNRGHHA